MVKLILNKLNKDESLIKYVKDRPNHDQKYTMDASKIKNLGWNPKYRFNKGIEEILNSLD